MEIRPVSLDQVALGNDGREYLITGEAGRIAAQLAEIEGVDLTVTFNEGGGYFQIAQEVDDPRPGHPARRKVPVMRVLPEDWTDQVVTDLQMRAWEVRHGISAAERFDREDDVHSAAVDHRLEQEVGAASYDLFRAVQKDVGTKPRVFIPERRFEAA